MLKKGRVLTDGNDNEIRRIAEGGEGGNVRAEAWEVFFAIPKGEAIIECAQG